MKKVATKAERQAASAAAFKHLSEQKLAEVEQPSEKKNGAQHSIKAVEADIKETQAAIITAVQKDHRINSEDTEKLNQRISQANDDAKDVFKRQSKPETAKTPWYAVFCCCIKPAEEEREPLLSALKK
jgi:hypothetical protein